MKEKIKWGCIQPLTGGMYIGAEKAFGHPASWIISCVEVLFIVGEI